MAFYSEYYEGDSNKIVEGSKAKKSQCHKNLGPFSLVRFCKFMEKFLTEAGTQIRERWVFVEVNWNDLTLNGGRNS